MLRSTDLGAGTLAAVALLLAGPSQAMPLQDVLTAEAVKPPPSNLFGAPLTRGLQRGVGGGIEYTRTELQRQKNAWLAQGGGIETGPLGGCELEGAHATWKWFDMGTGIGAAGFSVTAANGVPEIIVTGGGFGFGGARYWQILRFNAATGGYDQRFTSPVYDPGVRRMTSGDVDGDGANEVIVAIDGRIEIWDQATFVLESEMAGPSDVTAMKLVDVDGNGSLEIVAINSSLLRAYAADGTVVTALTLGGSDFATGQMDADASLELALTSGEVIDLDTGTIQWTNTDTFGYFVEAGDIDGDGFDEVIGTGVWGSAWAYDIDTQLPKWSMSIFNVGSTDLTDVDGDGDLDFIVGEAQWGDQLIYDAGTRALVAAINNPEHGTTEVIVADADGDGVKDVIWGAGHSSTGQDQMYVGDWTNETRKWESIDFDGPFRAPSIGDIDGDGDLEIVTMSNESGSGYSSGRILVFDAETFAQEAVSPGVAGGLGWSGSHEVLLVNIDSDPALEMFVATSTTYDGLLTAWDYDGTTFTSVWSAQGPFSGGAFRDVEVIDVDGDSELEVVASADDFVYVFDLATEALEWTTPFSLGGPVVDIEIGNVDGDPALELVALASDGDIAVFDGASQSVEALLQISAASIEIAEAPMGPDLLRVGMRSGALATLRHDGSNYEEIARVNLSSNDIENLVLRGGQVVFAGVDDALRMYEITSGTEIWSSCRDYGASFGEGVAFSDDYIITTGLYGIVVFAR